LSLSEQLTFAKVCACDAHQFDIIFIHGLTGDPAQTWTSKSSTEPSGGFWPKWLCDDLQNVSIYTLGYPASVFQKWASKEMTLFETAEGALEYLASYDIGTRPLAFITHSLGGLLTKQMLRTAKETSTDGWNAIGEHTRLVAFIATPHSGASLAQVLKSGLPSLASAHVAALTNDSGHLDDLTKAYREITAGAVIPIRTLAYYEKYKTNGLTIVTDQYSADPGVQGTRAIAVEADHISICKPENRHAFIYRSIHTHLKRVLAKCAVSSPITTVITNGDTIFGPDDYAQASDSDRRDLLQKLIDSSREHEFQNANDHQNKFAQRYYRLGLHTEAKLKNDQLLSDVEQRFNLHVYQNKICRAASDDEIARAIQTDVIDAICTKYQSEPTVSSTGVLRALYFLTQQCHIRWDHP
jgi:hypothetical protein